MGGLSFDAVVFDVDGVLFDTERVNRQAWTQISRELGQPHIADHYLECIGQTRADDVILIRNLTSPDFPAEDFLTRASLLCREWMSKEVPVKPGVREVLQLLQDKGIPIGMATSTYRERTMMRLELTGLTDYFHSITTGDEVSRGKPNPEIYLTACQKLGTDPKRTIAIEDSHKGIQAAAAAGMQVIMVPDLLPPTPETDALLLRRFDSLLEVRNFLTNN